MLSILKKLTMKRINLDETDSTNNYLRQNKEKWSNESIVVTADFQTAGRGQATNQWEAERGQNLLFSILIHPHHIEACEQFFISEAIALSIQQGLARHTDGVKIKWPNDIYIGEHKVCGILVENSVMGTTICDCIIGCGVNINQSEFHSDAPNPVSLRQATGREWEREEVLSEILENFGHFYKMTETEEGRRELHAIYMAAMYRWGEQRRYADAQGEFEATIVDVEPAGMLIMLDSDGAKRRYAFKEVRFI